jgi:hypothetical protein
MRTHVAKNVTKTGSKLWQMVANHVGHKIRTSLKSRNLRGEAKPASVLGNRCSVQLSYRASRVDASERRGVLRVRYTGKYEGGKRLVQVSGNICLGRSNHPSQQEKEWDREWIKKPGDNKRCEKTNRHYINEANCAQVQKDQPVIFI